MDNTKTKSPWTYLPIVFLTAVFCCVLWGSASPAIKIAYELFQIPADDTASRLMLAGARFILAGVMTIAFGSVLAKKLLVPKPESIRSIAVLALFQTIGQYFFFFMSLAHTSGVRGSIINASGNFLAPLFAIFIFRLEKPSVKKLLGCLVGFIGIILFLGGGAVLLLIGLVTGGSLHFYSTGCVWNLLYMGFISAGAYTLWGVLLKYNPVSRVSVFGFINPIMGVVLSAIFLGEQTEAFTLVSAVSLLLVSAGIIIVNGKMELLKGGRK